MSIDKEDFEAWMERIMDRFDKQDKHIFEINIGKNIFDGSRLYDNQDICRLLNVSKRTLQRYRNSGKLPFYTIYHKTYYKENEVLEFIRNNFDKDKR